MLLKQHNLAPNKTKELDLIHCSKYYDDGTRRTNSLYHTTLSRKLFVFELHYRTV